MRRVQGPSASGDDKKRIRQDVITNFVLFGAIVGVIRISKHNSNCISITYLILLQYLLLPIVYHNAKRRSVVCSSSN